MMIRFLILILFVISIGQTSSVNASTVASLEELDLSALQYRHIGPIGNRVSAVVGVPGEPNIYYVGAASGGIFKTTDGGAHWEPVFDDQPVSSIGALAISASDPNVIWAGTGETNIRSNISIGNGIYRSTDAGKTWSLMGLEDTGRIGRVIIHPTEPETVYAASMGHCYGPQQERGVFKTTDAGASWERVLFVDEDTGASDLVMDPNNPRILFAGMWPMVIWPWGRQSGGPGGGLYMSRDGGSTWTRLEGKGLPDPPTGKIALAMSADNSNRVYALIETNSNREFAPLKDHQGVLWRSDDGGETWKMVNADHTLVQRPHYYSRLGVLPDDFNEVHFMSLRHSISLDGGLTYSRGNAGGDHHDIWIDPRLPNRMIVGHDQGISISVNRGKTWFRPQLPIAQMYHAYPDNQVPYFVYGNRQDGPSARGPSNSLTGGDIPVGAWHSVGGCESGFAIPDPQEPNVVWSGCYDGILDLYDVQTGHTRNVSIWPDAIESWPAADLKYRFQWTFPLAISPHDHSRVYAGSQHLHVTTDAGQSWKVISPDLTLNEKEKQTKTGGLTPDDSGPTIAPVLFAIAESPLEEGLIWAGTNDGQVQITRNAGESWTNVTSNIPDLPEWGAISNIEPSRFEKGNCYISVDLHQMGNTEPFVFKTDDYGNSWSSISSNIPKSLLSYVHCIREDPVRKGLLYLGTENAIYFSLDDGRSWRPLQTNLPHAPVHWLTIQEHFNDLVVATYGRGFWILDDITPLQQLPGEVLTSDVHLFSPRPAYRFRYRESSMQQPEDPGAGENPEYGASINYYFADVPEGEIKLIILNVEGAVIRELVDQGEGSGVLSKKAGLNRVYWDLRRDKVHEIKLRTKVLEHSHVPLGERGWRSMEEARRRPAPLVPPGEYTLKLSVGDEEYSETVKVLKDPNSVGDESDIGAAYGAVMELYEMANSSVDIINEIEWTRKQLYDLKELMKGHDNEDEVVTSLNELDDSLVQFEGKFFDLRLSGSGQDTLRWPRRFYAKLSGLISLIEKSDFPPTFQQLEVLAAYKEIYKGYLGEMEKLQREVVAFNRRLSVLGIGVILRSSE